MVKSIGVAIVLAGFWIAGVAGAQTATNVVCASCVGTTDIAKNAVTTGKIIDGTIVSADLRDNSITGVKIRNGSIGLNDLDAQLQGGLIASITTLSEFATEEGAAAVSCPSDRIPVSASCACNDQEGARSFGVLFFCAVVGDGALAACFPEAGTFDAELPAPAAEVAAVCLGAASVDGTPWLPVPTGLLADSSSMTGESAVAHADWVKKQHSVLQAELAKMRRQQGVQRSRNLLRQ